MVTMSANKRRKKRSLRGKLFLIMACVIILCILICIIKLISAFVIPGDKKIENIKGDTHGNYIDNSAAGEEDEEISSQHRSDQESTSNQMNCPDKEAIEVVRGNELIKKIASTILTVPYEENARCKIEGKKVEIDKIDSFGLADYVYAIMKGKHLSDVGIDASSLVKCSEVQMKDLQVGDVGVCKIDDSIIYGIYVGKAAGHPLFAYACDLSNGSNESGSVYISYNKNESNDLFLGMYPMPYEKYYRLPGIRVVTAAEYKITELIAPELVPSKRHINNAAAVYRIGEWINANDFSKLMERINTAALNYRGYMIDENIYKSFIESYNETVGTNNFILRITNFEKFDGFYTVLAEVVMISDTDRTFTDSGINFECTVYDDGSYLPGSVLALSKNAILYGYMKKPIDSTNESVSKEIIIPEGIVETEQSVQGPGFSIDIGNIEPE